ncbi:MAG: tRNA methyl transferase PRC-barrel domain-containing protein, partial [Hydrogenothermaceae bacterium]
GEVIHISGKVLGKHRGLSAYTVGQRRGLSIPWKEPLYVIDKDYEKNIIIVGEKEHLLTDFAKAKDFNFLVDIKFWKDIKVQGRYRQKPVEVKSFEFDGQFLTVCFKEPQPKFASGQILAVYQEDMLLGGGIIV